MSAVLTWLHLKFQAQGGDGVLQRIKRIIYDAKSTVVVSFIFCKQMVMLLVKMQTFFREFRNNLYKLVPCSYMHMCMHT